MIELDEVPEGTATITTDGITYYYIDGAFYVPDTESGKNVYAVAEPPLGGEFITPPDGSVLFTEHWVRYYQFDNVFFTEQPDGGYVIVAEPGG